MELVHELLPASLRVNDFVNRHPVQPRCTFLPAHQLKRHRQHVLPIDPVVQRVKPKPRLSLGLLIQPQPQSRKLLRTRPPTGPSWVVLRWPVQFFRSVISMIQAVLPTSCLSACTVGPLRSTGITPLLSYYQPRRLPVTPAQPYVFSSTVGSHPRAGPPRFLIRLSARALPNHPGMPSGC